MEGGMDRKNTTHPLSLLVGAGVEAVALPYSAITEIKGTSWEFGFCSVDKGKTPNFVPIYGMAEIWFDRIISVVAIVGRATINQVITLGNVNLEVRDI